MWLKKYCITFVLISRNMDKTKKEILVCVFNTADFSEQSNQWSPLTVLLIVLYKYVGSQHRARTLHELYTSYM